MDWSNLHMFGRHPTRPGADSPTARQPRPVLSGYINYATDTTDSDDDGDWGVGGVTPPPTPPPSPPPFVFGRREAAARPNTRNNRAVMENGSLSIAHEEDPGMDAANDGTFGLAATNPTAELDLGQYARTTRALDAIAREQFEAPEFEVHASLGNGPDPETADIFLDIFLDDYDSDSDVDIDAHNVETFGQASAEESEAMDAYNDETFGPATLVAGSDSDSDSDAMAVVPGALDIADEEAAERARDEQTFGEEAQAIQETRPLSMIFYSVRTQAFRAAHEAAEVARVGIERREAEEAARAAAQAYRLHLRDLNYQRTLEIMAVESGIILPRDDYDSNRDTMFDPAPEIYLPLTSQEWQFNAARASARAGQHVSRYLRLVPRPRRLYFPRL